MEGSEVIHNTFVVERSYPQPPERVWAAFAQPNRKRRWYAEGNHEICEFEMEFKEGGSERFRYRFKAGHPLAGMEIANRTNYEVILPDQRIVTSSTMLLDGKPVSVSLITFEFAPSDTGTNLICTHQGVFFEGSGGPEMREAGWRSLFERLAKEMAI